MSYANAKMLHSTFLRNPPFRMDSDARFDALCAWLAASAAGADGRHRPGICRCEFSSLLPRHLAIVDFAAGKRHPGAHAHRHGRATAAGGLPALRRGCRLAHRCGCACSRSARRKPDARVLAALRSRHAHLSSGALRCDRAGAVSGSKRRARPLAAGKRRRRAATLRRGLAHARAQPVSRLVHREASRDRAQ